MPLAASTVAWRRYPTASPARNIETSWPSAAAVRATRNARAARVVFSGPVARWTRSFDKLCLLSVICVTDHTDWASSITLFVTAAVTNRSRRANAPSSRPEQPSPLDRDVPPVDDAERGVAGTRDEPERVGILAKVLDLQHEAHAHRAVHGRAPGDRGHGA